MLRADSSVEKFFQLSLLGLVASGFFAIAGSGYLDTATLALTAAGLALRAALALGLIHFEVTERAVTVLIIAYIGFYPIDYQYLSGDFLRATVHLLFFLAIVRILTAKTNRDYLYTAIIALLELLAATLLSVQLNFFLFLGFFVVFTIATLTSSEIRRATESVSRHSGQIARRSIRLNTRLAALTALVTTGILTLTAGLFFLLPRTANAALRHLAARGYYLPGFSNQVTLGQIGEIKTRSTAVMHIRVYDSGGRFNAKWRGAALSDFDGRKWSNGPEQVERLPVRNGRVILAADDQRRRIGQRVAYRVDVKSIDTATLFFAGIPEAINLNAPSVLRTAQDNYRVGLGTADGIRYDVYSFLDDQRISHVEVSDNAWIPPAIHTRYTQLPPIDPRIPDLARKMSAGETSVAGRAAAIENHLRRDYGYTLELPQMAVADPVAHFLFTRKKGHCEYFASAMAVLLRSIGIPTRMVTGFQSGTFNPVSELYVIRASDAHTWVEAYLPARGWTTFDPTPADPNPPSQSVWTTLGFYLDAADTFWQDWVVSYDLGRQLLLADKMEQSSSRFRIDWLNWTGQSTARWQSKVGDLLRDHLTPVLILLAVSLGGVLFGPSGWRSLKVGRRVRRAKMGRASMADATLLYNRFLDLLTSRGYTKPPWFTPTELARSVRDTEVGGLTEQFVAAYQELRFGGKAEAAPKLFILLDELKRQT